MATSSQTSTPPPTFREQQEARRRNETSYESTVAVQGLPSAHIAWEATPAAVQVTATGIDVLAEWLHVQGGSISTVELPSGQTVWTLHTTTWTDSPRFPAVPVHVTVVLPTDEQVIPEIRAAVAA
ncbi:hypothetical protein [Streptomyces sp. NPDC001635]